ncbi:MAG: hypothetical protein CL524_13315 [Aequorivita sp.]|nr:hypothetical protein [Aequorivita sp.]MBF31142.1 hypothetical protein [Aequorivita sp.]
MKFAKELYSIFSAVVSISNEKLKISNLIGGIFPLNKLGEKAWENAHAESLNGILKNILTLRISTYPLKRLIKCYLEDLFK